MKKKTYLITTVILGLLSIILIIVGMEHKKYTLTEGYVEVNLNKNIIYPESKNLTFLSFFYNKKSANPNAKATIQDGKLEINDGENILTKEWENEKAISLSSRVECGYNEIPYFYVLTDKKNVYRSPLIYDEKTQKFISNALQGNFTKIFDGSNLKEEDIVSLIRLNGNNEAHSCLFDEVYLKINDKVIDFNGILYEDIISKRDIWFGNSNINYYFDGTLQIDETKEYIKDENGNKIKFMILGIESNKTYFLDEDGREYYSEDNEYNMVLNAKDGVLLPTSQRKVLKIGKKDQNYEIIFEDGTKKQVYSEDKNNRFSVIPGEETLP